MILFFKIYCDFFKIRFQNINVNIYFKPNTSYIILCKNYMYLLLLLSCIW